MLRTTCARLVATILDSADTSQIALLNRYSFFVCLPFAYRTRRSLHHIFTTYNFTSGVFCMSRVILAKTVLAMVGLLSAFQKCNEIINTEGMIHEP